MPQPSNGQMSLGSIGRSPNMRDPLFAPDAGAIVGHGFRLIGRRGGARHLRGWRRRDFWFGGYLGRERFSDLCFRFGG